MKQNGKKKSYLQEFKDDTQKPANSHFRNLFGYFPATDNIFVLPHKPTVVYKDLYSFGKPSFISVLWHFTHDGKHMKKLKLSFLSINLFKLL